MSVAKAIKNDASAMSAFLPVEGIYVIGGAGIEHIADVVGGGHSYSGGGSYTVSGLVIGQTYTFTPGANDTSLTNGAASEVNGVPVTPIVLTATGQFTASATTATLAGTASAGVTATIIPTGLFFQKLWLYPGKAVASGILTANGAAIHLGKSGFATTQYLPDTLNPTDAPMKYELPLGQKMALDQVLIKGSAGDGVFYQFT